MEGASTGKIALVVHADTRYIIWLSAQKSMSDTFLFSFFPWDVFPFPANLVSKLSWADRLTEDINQTAGVVNAEHVANLSGSEQSQGRHGWNKGK